jgi:hypothetical protein
MPPAVRVSVAQHFALRKVEQVDPVPALRALEVVQGQVDGDPINPRRELRVAPELVAGLEDLHEDLLRDVLRLIATAPVFFCIRASVACTDRRALTRKSGVPCVAHSAMRFGHTSVSMRSPARGANASI